jgi:hypothetical protein
MWPSTPGQLTKLPTEHTHAPLPSSASQIQCPGNPRYASANLLSLVLQQTHVPQQPLQKQQLMEQVLCGIPHIGVIMYSLPTRLVVQSHMRFQHKPAQYPIQIIYLGLLLLLPDQIQVPNSSRLYLQAVQFKYWCFTWRRLLLTHLQRKIYGLQNWNYISNVVAGPR